MTPYDPHTHAAALRLRVDYGDPGPGRNGLYTQGRIILRPGLTRRVERCVLAHEIVHAEYDDRPTPDPVWHAKREHRADRIAAHRLIHPNDLAQASRTTTDPGRLALDLDVTAWILQAYNPHH